MQLQITNMLLIRMVLMLFAYVGRNGYGQLSEVKTETFSTKARVMDNPGASKATIDITISDPGRTSLKLTYTYNQEAAVYYHPIHYDTGFT